MGGPDLLLALLGACQSQCHPFTLKADSAKVAEVVRAGGSGTRWRGTGYIHIAKDGTVTWCRCLALERKEPK